MTAPFISFLSDCGERATAPAICRGVMWGIAPAARILDLTHAVTPCSIREGALLLWTAVPYLPVGVHVAVVDPGVGTARHAVVLRVGRGDLLVGPDNGLLRPAAERLGGIVEARIARNPDLWLPEVSSNFHGRDLFSPLAAHLAMGVEVAKVGPTITVEELVPLAMPTPIANGHGFETSVLFIDRFGNVRIAGDLPDLEAALGPMEAGQALRLGTPEGPLDTRWATTFGSVAEGQTLVYRDADTAGLAIAVNRGSAADELGLALDDPIRIDLA